MLTPRELELLQLVHAHPGTTRAEGAAALSASSGTITSLVRSLRDARLLDETPAAPSGIRGRPTRSLVPHPEGPLVVVGVVSHVSWTLSASEIGGAVVAEESHVHGGEDGERLVDGLLAGVASLERRLSGRTLGLGLALPGVVRGDILVDAPLLSWRSLDLRPVAKVLDRADEAHPLLVTGNDATFAGLGEAVRGAAQDAEMHAHLYLDAGLGGALTHRGSVVPGALGVGGEFGHMPFGDPGASCPCGATSCWTTAVGALALARALGEPQPVDAVRYAGEVLERARAGDSRAMEAVERMAASLGRGIAGLVNGLDIDLVTLGGWAPAISRLVPQAIDDAYTAGLMRFRRPAAPLILVGSLGSDAPRVGAQELLWSRLWAQL